MTTADESALLAAIRVNPADDAPRLVYADWLDENGESGRAEFIRVQVELARMGEPHIQVTESCVLTKKYGPDYYTLTGGEETSTGRLIFDAKVGSRVDVLKPRGKKPIYGLRVVKFRDDIEEIVLAKDMGSTPWEGESLRSREAELWRDHWQTWFGHEHELLFKGQAGKFEVGTFRNGNGGYEFSRGFVSHVTAPFATLIGGECRTCHGEGRILEDHDGKAGYGRCEHCESGHIPGVLSAIMQSRCAAVERVTASDKRPIRLECDQGNVFHWMKREPEPQSPWFVVQEIFDELNLPHQTIGGERMDGKYAGSEAAALDALRDALIRWAWSIDPEASNVDAAR